jgi:hypothetical protein
LIHRKQRKDPADSIDLEEQKQFALTEPDPIEIASGFSISVKHGKDGRPMIYVKRYGNVDTQGLRREIERNYPGAAIQGLGHPQTIEMAGDQKKSSRRSRAKRSKRTKK